MNIAQHFFNFSLSGAVPANYFFLGIVYWTFFIFQNKKLFCSYKSIFSKMFLLLCWLAVSFHSYVLYKTIYLPDELELGFALALSATAGVAILYFCSLALFQKIELLALIMLPVAALMTLPPLFFSSPRIYFFESKVFLIHLGFALFAYGTLGFAASLSLFMALLEANLRKFKTLKNHDFFKKFSAFIFDGPSLINLENLLFQIIGAAFLGLSLTLITGFIFSKELNLSFRWDHKNLFAFFAWLIVGALLLGRWYYGWRGRITLIYVLGGYLALIFSYIGTQIILQLVLHRI